MSEPLWSQVSITFHDVAVYFSEKEWGSLQEWQKELYRNVMKEIHSALISLGYAIVNPEILFRIKSEKELLFKDSQDTESKARGKTPVSVTSYPVLNPDIFLRIKQEVEEDACYKESPEARHPFSDLNTTHLDATSTLTVTVKQEAALCPTEEENQYSSALQESQREKDAFCPDTTFTDHSPNIIVIKEEPSHSLCPQKPDEAPSHPTESNATTIQHEQHPTLYCEGTKPCRAVECEPPSKRLPFSATHPRSQAGEMQNTSSELTNQARNHAGFSVDHTPNKYSYIQKEEHYGVKEKHSKQTLYARHPVQKHAPTNKNEKRTTVYSEEALLHSHISDGCQEQLLKDFDNIVDFENLSRAQTCHGIQHRTPDKNISKTLYSPGTYLINQTNMYKCPECERYFSDKATLLLHVRTHADKRLYKCTSCKRCFRDSNVLLLHLKTHAEEIQYMCPECGKSFSHCSNLRFHQRIHTGDRLYKCPNCIKNFTKFYYLKVHLRTHTGERPHRCTQCDNRFRDNSALTKHQRIHTGEQPFKCNGCEKSFRDSSTLNVHQRIHTGERPYKCSECEKGFGRRIALTKHMSTHLERTLNEEL